MAGMRTEMYHNTPAQARDYLREALDIVDELGPPDDLRQLAFDKAVNLVSAKNINIEQMAPAIPNMTIPRGRH